MSEQKTIYDLNFHEYYNFHFKDKESNTISGDTISVVRVPGGWLYNEYGFVPFNNEFMEVNKK